MLEVVRSVVHEPKVLLLDEPTAVLDVPAAERLQTLIRQIRDAGCAIVYVSHRLEEVRRLADRLTVLRDGVIQGTHDSMDWDVEHIVELMVGAPVDLEFPPRPVVAAEDRPTVFEVDGLEAPGVGPVSITVGSGEIVGIAGAEGSGQRQLLRGLLGIGRKAGSVRVNGKEVPANPSGALKAGVNFQSGDRVAESVFPTMTVADNSTIQLGADLGPAGLNLPSKGLPRFRQVCQGPRHRHRVAVPADRRALRRQPAEGRALACRAAESRSSHHRRADPRRRREGPPRHLQRHHTRRRGRRRSAGQLLGLQ